MSQCQRSGFVRVATHLQVRAAAVLLQALQQLPPPLQPLPQKLLQLPGRHGGLVALKGALLWAGCGRRGGGRTSAGRSAVVSVAAAVAAVQRPLARSKAQPELWLGAGPHQGPGRLTTELRQAWVGLLLGLGAAAWAYNAVQGDCAQQQVTSRALALLRRTLAAALRCAADCGAERTAWSN